MFSNSISSCLLNSVLLFVLSLKPDTVSASQIFRPSGRNCDIRREVIEVLGYNTTSKTLINLEDGYDDENNPIRLLASISEDNGDDISEDWENNLFMDNIETLDSTVADQDEIKIIKVRKCVCAGDNMYINQAFYCPAESNFCNVPRKSYSGEGYYVRRTPICLHSARELSIVRYAWFLAVIIFSLFFTCLICTPHGNNALGCLVSSICLPVIFDKVVVDRMLQHNPERARHLIRKWCIRRRQEIEEEFLQMDDNGNDMFNTLDDIEVALVKENEQDRPSLLLKTRIYKSQFEKPKLVKKNSFRGYNCDDDEDEDDEGASCTICFGPVKDGDRIGDFASCDHTFHVNCLKVWLKRRNVCPLCLEANVAVPRTDLDSANIFAINNDGNASISNENTIQGSDDDTNDNLEEGNTATQADNGASGRNETADNTQEDDNLRR